MAIQQSVNVTLTLLGDGTSTVFTYSFVDLFEIIADNGATVTNPRSLPTTTSVQSVNNLPSCVSSLDGFGNLVLTFSSAPAAASYGTITVQLLFNSGTTSGTTQAWTSSTAVNTTWTLPLSGSTSVSVGFVVSGSITGGVILFQVSQDGANWFTVQGAIASGYQSVTEWQSSTGQQILTFDTAGYSYFRLNLTTALVGSGTLTFIMQGDASDNEPVPVVGQAIGTNLHMTIDDGSGSGLTTNVTAKGTQGTNALNVQELKDAGRTPIILYVDSVSGITTEALATMNINKGGTTSTATEYTVTTGKTLRVETFILSVMVPATTGCASRARLRSAATVSATSPVFAHVGVGTPATAFAGNSASAIISDGLEFAGGQQVGISHIESSTIAGSTTTGAGVQITMIGYEY